MWTCLSSVKLIRYLLVLKVNGPLVRMPGCVSAELSSTLGTLIAGRLPTREAGPWRKALAPCQEDDGGASHPAPKGLDARPESLWPIEAVLHVYPGKLAYGQGELILWELKLFGESADHGFFLEVLLPALEEAGYTSDPRWRSRNRLWGRFDIHAVYAARGAQWEPLVREGRLNLRYRPGPGQWAEGLNLKPVSDRTFNCLSWLSPFDLREGRGEDGVPAEEAEGATPGEAPTLLRILEALIFRVETLITGRRDVSWDIQGVLTPEECSQLQDDVEQARGVALRFKRLVPAPKNWPGRWTGTQVFDFIPPSLTPYLQLASVLHIGRQTHFGCGTFALSERRRKYFSRLKTGRSNEMRRH